MKTVLIDDELHERLKYVKEKTGVPMVETIRRAVKQYLAQPEIDLQLKYGKQ